MPAESWALRTSSDPFHATLAPRQCIVAALQCRVSGCPSSHVARRWNEQQPLVARIEQDGHHEADAEGGRQTDGHQETPLQCRSRPLSQCLSKSLPLRARARQCCGCTGKELHTSIEHPAKKRAASADCIADGVPRPRVTACAALVLVVNSTNVHHQASAEPNKLWLKATAPATWHGPAASSC